MLGNWDIKVSNEMPQKKSSGQYGGMCGSRCSL